MNITQPVTIYLCDDTIDSIFTAIYNAWADGTGHTDIRIHNFNTMSLFETYISSKSDEILAQKVKTAIIQKLSEEIYLHVYNATLSSYNDKASVLYHFLQKAFKTGPSIINCLQDCDVLRIYELSRSVSNESHNYLGFVRFEELENGILAGYIRPKSNIIPIVAKHFNDRLHNENWILLDTSRSLAAIHPAGKEYYLQNNITEQMLLSVPLSSDEKEYQNLWNRFFTTVSINQRTNTDLQKNLLPLHYRTYMTEF